jgi:hypothetical protein
MNMHLCSWEIMRIVLCFFAEAAGVFKNNSATKKWLGGCGFRPESVAVSGESHRESETSSVYAADCGRVKERWPDRSDGKCRKAKGEIIDGRNFERMGKDGGRA